MQVSSFNRFEIWRGSQNVKSRSRNPFTTPFDVILHFFDSAILNLSNLTRISSLYGDIWLFYDYADLAAKCLFPPILGRFFLGVWPSKCSRILSRPPKGTSLTGNARLRIDWPDRSRNATWAHDEKSKRKKGKKKTRKKRNANIWHVTYLPRPPALRYPRPPPHQSCHVGWDPGRSQPCQVSSKSVQGFWLPDGSKSAIFLRYRPTCYLTNLAKPLGWNQSGRLEQSITYFFIYLSGRGTLFTVERLTGSYFTATITNFCSNKVL